MRKYRAMVTWWSENGPPVYVSVASYLGLVKPRKSKSKGTGDLNELLKLAGPGGMIN